MKNQHTLTLNIYMNERITQIIKIIQKTNKQIQIELKVKNVSKIRSRIYYTCTYIFNTYRINNVC